MDLVDLSPLASSLGMTSNALAKAISILRRRFRELFRAAVRDSLDLEPPPEGIADEACLEAARREEARLIDDELRELRRHFWS